MATIQGNEVSGCWQKQWGLPEGMSSQWKSTEMEGREVGRMEGRAGERKQGQKQGFRTAGEPHRGNAAQCKRSRRGMWDHLIRESPSPRKEHFHQEGPKKGS